MKTEKMTITWERYVERLATEDDVKADIEERRRNLEKGWREDQLGEPLKVGDEWSGEETVELPGKYEVCGRCQGKGSHVNPSIDGHGITEDEWNGPDWSDEDKENYLTGFYDVECYECHGRRVVLVVDEERCDKQLLKEYEASMRERAREEYYDRRTRWAEDGYRGSLDDY